MTNIQSFEESLKLYMPDVYEVITSEEWKKSSELLTIINEKKLTDEEIINELGITEEHLTGLLFGEIKGIENYDWVMKKLEAIK